MSKRPHFVPVTILGKEYNIACDEDEKDALIESANDLDKQMREIRDSGKVNSPDRIAVMVALNLNHELRQVQKQDFNPATSISNKLIGLRQKIENVLEMS